MPQVLSWCTTFTCKEELGMILVHRIKKGWHIFTVYIWAWSVAAFTTAIAVTNSRTNVMGAVICISPTKVYSLYSLRCNFGWEDASLRFHIFTDHALRQGENPDLLPWYSQAVFRSELQHNLIRPGPCSTTDQNSFPRETRIYRNSHNSSLG